MKKQEDCEVGSISDRHFIRALCGSLSGRIWIRGLLVAALLFCCPGQSCSPVAVQDEVAGWQPENPDELAQAEESTVDPALAAEQAEAVDSEADQAATEGDTVTLHALGSDTDTSGMQFTWTQISGTPVQLSAYDQAVVTFVAPTPSGDSETLVFEVSSNTIDGQKDESAAAKTVSDQTTVQVWKQSIPRLVFSILNPSTGTPITNGTAPLVVQGVVATTNGSTLPAGTYCWSFTKSGSTSRDCGSKTTHANRSWTLDTPGTYTIKLTAIIGYSVVTVYNQANGNKQANVNVQAPTSAPVSVQFQSNSSGNPEATSAPVIPVILSAPASSTVMAAYTIVGGTASNGTDYILAEGMLTFAANETTKYIPLSVINDATAEPNETIILSLPYAMNATVGANNSFTYTIHNDDAAGAPNLAVSPKTPQLVSGPQGGPCNPAAIVYTLTNTGNAAMTWAASASQSWVTLSKSGGSLAAGASDTVSATITNNGAGLAPGNYAALVSLNNTTNGVGNALGALGLTINAATPGSLSVTGTGGLASSGNVGGPFAPASIVYTLTNPGNASINWTAARTQPWVGLSKASGVLAGGASDTVTVSINTAANSLAAGSHSDTVTFSNTTNGTGNTTRPVSLSVNAAPGLLTVTPAGGLTSTGNQGGPFNSSTTTYTLTNTGASSLHWTATKTQAWVSLSKVSGTLGAGLSTTVVASIGTAANSLVAGSYNDTITFVNDTTASGNTTRPVALTVAAPPAPGVLSVTPATAMTSVGRQGGPFSPTSVTYTVTNTGGQSINWTATKTQSWLALSKSSGTLAAGASDTVVASLATAANSLSSGTHNTTITFTNTTNSTGNTTRAATLHIMPNLTIQASPNGGTAPVAIQLTAMAGASAVTAAQLPTGSTLNWDFGDSTGGTGIQVSHTYASSGTFAVVLALTLPAGLGNVTCNQQNLVLSAAPTGPMNAAFTTTTPTINGTLSAGEWADAGVYAMNATDANVPGVVNAGTTATAADTAAVIYVKHDANYVYVAVEVTDDSVVASAADVWDADAVELFLDADNSKTTDISWDQRLQFDIAAGGATYAAPAVSAGNWNGAGALRTGGYAVEYRISKSAFGLGATGSYGFDVNILDIEPAAGTLATGYWYFSTGEVPELNEALWGQITLAAQQINGPMLSITPAGGLTSTGNTGGPFSPASTTYTVRNTGNASMNWTAAKTQGWVALSKTGGTLAAGATDTVIVSYAAAANSLAAGSYSDTVSFTNTTNNAGNSTRSVSLTLGTTAGILDVTPTSGLSASGQVGGPFSFSGTNTYTVRNTGTASLNWTASKNQSWVTLSKTSGTLAVGATDTVTVTLNSNANSLAANSHSDLVTFTNTSNNSGNTTRTLALSVTPPSGSSQPMTTASRTTGVAPLAVFFDAVNTSSPAWSSGVVQPTGTNPDYASFYYKWNFGDSNSGNWSTNGKSRNEATGYVAAHVYETPGTYTVSLHVIDAAGTARDYTQQITVQAFSGTTYYVSNSAGNDSNNGTSTSTPFKSFSKAMSVVGSNRRILFNRGESWSVSSAQSMNANGPGILGAYGTGAAPRLSFNGNDSGISFAGNDWRFVDLEIVGETSTSVHPYGTAGLGFVGATQVLALRVTISGFDIGLANSWANANGNDQNTWQEVHLYNSNINGYPGGRRLAMLGCRIDQASESHLLRIWHMYKGVLANSSLLDPGGDRLALKFHNEIELVPELSPQQSQYCVISGNNFRGQCEVVVIGPQWTGPGADERISDVLFERNTVRATSITQAGLQLSARYVTVRNNVVIATGSSPWFTAIVIRKSSDEPAPVRMRVLNNTVYRADNASEFTFCRVMDGTDVEVRNNLVAQPNFTGYMNLMVDNSVPVTASNNLSTAAPLFVNAGNEDFRLQTNSPARNAGIVVPTLFDDFGMNLRPISGAYDIGAWEQ